ARELPPMERPRRDATRQHRTRIQPSLARIPRRRFRATSGELVADRTAAPPLWARDSPPARARSPTAATAATEPARAQTGPRRRARREIPGHRRMGAGPDQP